MPPALAAALGAALVLGGPQVPFLRATMYEEVLHWSSAFAALFVFQALAGLIEENIGRRLRWLALAAGLALPAALMLGFVFMNHRYRQEFYPLLSFAAFAGIWLRPVGLPSWRTWAGLAAIGIGFSHLFLWFYLRSGMGPADVRAVQMFLRSLGL